MAVPSYTLEIALTTPPLDVSPVWTTIHNAVRSFSSDRGKSGEFEDNGAGTATIMVDNRNGYLTPSNASSPYFGDLLPNRRVRLTQTYNAVAYVQFEGFIEAFEQKLDTYSEDVVCALRCVDGTKVLNLERTPEYDDYADRVSGEVLEPIWGYWRLNEPPSTRVRPGGYVKMKDNKDRGKKPQKKWRKKKRTRFLTGVSGPEAQVIGNPAFLQSTVWDGTGGGGPVMGEMSYGIGFDKGLSQHLRVPVAEADDRPGAENAITVSCLVYPGQNSDSEEGILVGGPMVAAASTPSWWLELVGQEAQFNILVAAGLVVCVTTGDAVPRNGEWHHIVATFRGDQGVAQIFVDGERAAVETNISGGGSAGGSTIRRGDTAAPVFIAGHPTYQTALGGGTTEYFTGLLSEVVVSEHKFPNETTNEGIRVLADTSSAGVGTPASPNASGVQVGFILDGLPNRDVTGFLNEPSFFTGARRSLDVGESLVLPQRLDDDKLGLLNKVEEAENGMLFVAKDGTLTFHDNGWALAGAGATVRATLKNDGIGLPYRSLTPSLSDDFLFPVVTVTREGGNPQTVSDTTEFFGAALELNDTLHILDEDALDHATRLQEQFGTARQRVQSVEIHAGTDDRLYPHVLGRELGDRVVVEHDMPDGSTITADCRIIGIRRESFGVEHTAQWALAPSYMPTVAEWYLGVSGFSELQETTTLA